MVLEAEDRCLTDVEQALWRLRAEVSTLESRLNEEKIPRVTEGDADLLYLHRQRVELQALFDDISEGRLRAQNAVASLNRQQLSEIKMMLRSPPETIKRTLLATWILLKAASFKGKQVVDSDEKKDWPKCQRMLADEGFTKEILNFDIARLDEVPHVLTYVAQRFFGIGMTSSTRRPSASVSISESPKQTSAIARSQSLPVVKRGSFTSSPFKRRSTIDALPTPKAPLDVQTVERACAPCGALLAWMLALVQEFVERERIKREIATVEQYTVDVVSTLAITKVEICDLEAALAALRARIEILDAELTRLLQERTYARKSAEDLLKLNRLCSSMPMSNARLFNLREEPKYSRSVAEISDSMAHVQHELSNLRVPFEDGAAKVLKQHISVHKIASLLDEHDQTLKILIEGHQDEEEKDGVDMERSLAVYDWLVNSAGISPGRLRVAGRGSSGVGRYAIPVPIDEVIATSGPMTAKVQQCKDARPGLFFDVASCALVLETRSIASSMAQLLCLESDVVVRIEGHIDKSEAKNLAMERAMTVRELLVGLGVASRRLHPMSCLDRHPASCMYGALNRRVEIHLE